MNQGSVKDSSRMEEGLKKGITIWRIQRIFKKLNTNKPNNAVNKSVRYIAKINMSL